MSKLRITVDIYLYAWNAAVKDSWYEYTMETYRVFHDRANISNAYFLPMQDLANVNSKESNYAIEKVTI